MSIGTSLAAPPCMTLGKVKASDMMTANPVSLRESASVADAIELFTRRRISAAPVIDEAGRPVGVLSRTDILVHGRENKSPGSSGIVPHRSPSAESPRMCVRDLMTPVVFCVSPEAPAQRVVREMVDLKVHRLFVVEDQGILVGVISVLDVLRHVHR